MACERYREDLLGTAAGWLEPEREMRFDAHRRVCPACREEFERQQRLFAALDEGLHAQVNDELPAGFAARVRVRMKEQSAPGMRWRPPWVPAWRAIAGVAALAAALFIVHVLRDVRTPANPPTLVATKGPPRGTATAAATPPPAAAVHTANSHVHLRLQRLTAKLAPPEVLLPPGHQQAMARLVEGLRAGEVQGEMLLAENAKLRPVQIAPLEIDAIELKPLEENRQQRQ